MDEKCKSIKRQSASYLHGCNSVGPCMQHIPGKTSTSNRCVLAVSFEIKLKLLDSSIHDLDGGCLAKGLYLRSLKRKAPADEDASERSRKRPLKPSPRPRPRSRWPATPAAWDVVFGNMAMFTKEPLLLGIQLQVTTLALNA